MFKQSIIEQLGSYVYLLKDKTTKEVFYVGKGNGNRVFQHVEEYQSSDYANAKLKRIEKIGIENIEYLILRHGLDDKTAFEIEAAIIDYIGLDKLTNIVTGKNSSDFGIKTLDEIITMYDAEELQLMPDENCILININKLYSRDMSAEQLYEITRQKWRIGAKRNNVIYAIPNFRGLTREVYRITNWYPIGNRWGFNGVVAEEAVRKRLRLKSIVPFQKKGASNPIRYINI